MTQYSDIRVQVLDCIQSVPTTYQPRAHFCVGEVMGVASRAGHAPPHATLPPRRHFHTTDARVRRPVDHVDMDVESYSGEKIELFRNTRCFVTMAGMRALS
jgi:hypothetical protein